MAQEIKLAKLVSGDMVLGKWDAQENKIKDPATLQTVPTQQGGVQMALLPFGYPFDSELHGEISAEHVLFWYQTVPEDLTSKYWEASSNISISSSSDLENLQNMAGDKGKGGGITDIGDLLK